ncbi:MAG: hypothetical protein AAF937_11670 [Planctomycetota bacterium]
MMTRHNNQILNVEDESGRQIRIGTAGFDSPFVHFVEPDGTVIMEMMATKTGHSLFEMLNPETGEPAITIDTATSNGAARIVLYDPKTGQPAKTITFESQ